MAVFSKRFSDHRSNYRGRRGRGFVIGVAETIRRSLNAAALVAFAEMHEHDRISRARTLARGILEHPATIRHARPTRCCRNRFWSDHGRVVATIDGHKWKSHWPHRTTGERKVSKQVGLNERS